jgi:hypothetical protein
MRGSQNFLDVLGGTLDGRVAVHFGAREVEGFGNLGHGDFGHASECRLKVVKDRRKRTVTADMLLDDLRGEIGAPRFVHRHASDKSISACLDSFRIAKVATKRAFSLRDF